jgi:hypothetical protein
VKGAGRDSCTYCGGCLSHDDVMMIVMMMMMQEAGTAKKSTQVQTDKMGRVSAADIQIDTVRNPARLEFCSLDT